MVRRCRQLTQQPYPLSCLQVLPQLAGDRLKVHYLVKDVHVNQHEKVLHLEGTYTQEQVVVHLQDGWHDTPVQPGHSVNLIAGRVMGSDGLLHAVCDFNAGTQCQYSNGSDGLQL